MRLRGKNVADQDFQTENPIGRDLPCNTTCAPVDHAKGQIPTTCILGPNPTYTVNVTSRNRVAETLRFARLNNIRLTVANIGHDMLGRSDGYGSLEIWIRYFRNCIDFQKEYKSAADCSTSESQCNGSTIRIEGAWQ